MTKKYYLTDDLKLVVEKNKKENKKVGFANGCFDLLHDGHLKLIKEAKRQCDFFIIGLNSDRSIREIKGIERPIENEETRIKNIEKIEIVDAIILFDENTPEKLINDIMPNVLFKGSDYRNKKIVGSDVVKNNGGKVVLIDLLRGFSTTKQVKQMMNNG